MYTKHFWTKAGKSGVDIRAKNGAIIAECKTEAMADKIIEGLRLLKIRETKIKNFRI